MQEGAPSRRATRSSGTTDRGDRHQRRLRDLSSGSRTCVIVKGYQSIVQGVRARDASRPSRAATQVVHRPHLLRLRGAGEADSCASAPTRSASARRSARSGSRPRPSSSTRAARSARSQRKFFPGYILVEMEMSDETWHVVKNTPKVTGFVGTGKKPTPLSQEEVDQILEQVVTAKEKPKPKYVFEKGEPVKIIDGPFNNFTGVVEDVNLDRNTLQGHGHDLRPADPGRAGFPAGSEARRRSRRGRGVGWRRKSSGRQAADPGRAGDAGAAGGPGAGPGRRQHHGLLQDLQRPHQGAAGPDHPGGDHGLRRPQLHLHHQDAAGGDPAAQGGRGRRRARACRTATRSAR